MAAFSGLESADRRLPESEAVRAIMEFLTFLRLRGKRDETDVHFYLWGPWAPEN